MVKTTHSFRFKEGIHDKLKEITTVHQQDIEEYMKKVKLDNDKLNVKISPSAVIETLIEEEYKRLFPVDDKEPIATIPTDNA